MVNQYVSSTRAKSADQLALRAMAGELYQAGILAFPATAASKHPDRGVIIEGKPRWAPEYFPPNGWPTPEQHAAIFKIKDVERQFLVCGGRSRGLLCIDFDVPDLFEEWKTLIPAALLARLYLERSQHSGRVHVAYVLDGDTPDSEVIAVTSERKVKIETRGEGSGFIAAPSVGYTWMQGDLRNLSVLTMEEHATLIDAAASFTEDTSEYDASVMEATKRNYPARLSPRTTDEPERPGDRYNYENGQEEVLALLEKHGWTIGRDFGGKVSVLRPGEPTSNSSGNVSEDGTLVVFSTNAQPFEAYTSSTPRWYDPFGVYATLEHGGDLSASAAVLAKEYASTPTHEPTSEQSITGNDALLSLATPYDRWTSKFVSIKRVMLAGPELPDYQLDPLIVKGRVHCLYGGPDQGKSMLTLSLVAQTVRAGHRVLMLDEEAGKNETAERLMGMGVTEDEAELITYAPFTLGGLSLMESGENIQRFVREQGIRLVILDSLSKSLVAAGLDENSNGDCSKWYRAWATPVAKELGVAVWILDHVTKSDDGGSGYGRGASSKLADVDIQWHISASVRPTRDAMGQLVLTKKKDHTAMLPETVTYLAGGDGSGSIIVKRKASSYVPAVRVDKKVQAMVKALYGEKI